MEPIDIAATLAGLDAGPGPGASADLVAGGQSIRILRVQGTGEWHSHARVDETVLVWRGAFRVEYRDRAIDLAAGQIAVVPAGAEHRGIAEHGAEIVLLKPAA